ncbi:MAG: DUF11 domain-containing protein, partial [Anaerohalosphaera sp.]|nr:DUF11 domain-containing protein [Anaerohalosphaera sp.]
MMMDWRKGCLAAGLLFIVVLAGSVFGQTDAVTLGIDNGIADLTEGVPYFKAIFDDAGYSDYGIFYGQSDIHEFPLHELLSGEWGAAIYFDGIATGDKAMWLTDMFLYPDWATNSNFVGDPNSRDEGDNSNNSPGYDFNDYGQSVIRNGKLEITIDYEVVDLGEDGYSPMAGLDAVTGDGGFVKSDRYIFLQTYTIKNVDPNETTVEDIEFYQMLHSHGADVYDDVVNSVYSDFEFEDEVLENYTPFNSVHQIGNFRYDITQWNSSPASHIDHVGFSSTIEPDWIDNDIFRGHWPGKPGSGTHINIENRELNEDESIFDDEVAGAMGYDLGDVAFGESVSITFAFMFGHGGFYEAGLKLDKYDEYSNDPNFGCVDPMSVDPNDQTVTYTIDYGNPETDENDPNYVGQVTGVWIVDYLPDEINRLDVEVSSGGGHSFIDNTVTWYAGTLEPNDSGSVWVKVKVT